MPMIDEPPERFLMTPRRHREWAERARRHDRPDLALQHEQFARVIEKIAKEQAGAAKNASRNRLLSQSMTPTVSPGRTPSIFRQLARRLIRSRRSAYVSGRFAIYPFFDP
jgi:hypothetical protein